MVSMFLICFRDFRIKSTRILRFQLLSSSKKYLTLSLKCVWSICQAHMRDPSSYCYRWSRGWWRDLTSISQVLLIFVIRHHSLQWNEIEPFFLARDRTSLFWIRNFRKLVEIRKIHLNCCYKFNELIFETWLRISIKGRIFKLPFFGLFLEAGRISCLLDHKFLYQYPKIFE